MTAKKKRAIIAFAAIAALAISFILHTVWCNYAVELSTYTVG